MMKTLTDVDRTILLETLRAELAQTIPAVCWIAARGNDSISSEKMREIIGAMIDAQDRIVMKIGAML